MNKVLTIKKHTFENLLKQLPAGNDFVIEKDEECVFANAGDLCEGLASHSFIGNTSDATLGSDLVISCCVLVIDHRHKTIRVDRTDNKVDLVFKFDLVEETADGDAFLEHVNRSCQRHVIDAGGYLWEKEERGFQKPDKNCLLFHYFPALGQLVISYALFLESEKFTVQNNAEWMTFKDALTAQMKHGSRHVFIASSVYDVLFSNQ